MSHGAAPHPHPTAPASSPWSAQGPLLSAIAITLILGLAAYLGYRATSARYIVRATTDIVRFTLPGAQIANRYSDLTWYLSDVAVIDAETGTATPHLSGQLSFAAGADISLRRYGEELEILVSRETEGPTFQLADQGVSRAFANGSSILCGASCFGRNFPIRGEIGIGRQTGPQLNASPPVLYDGSVAIVIRMLWGDKHSYEIATEKLGLGEELTFRSPDDTPPPGAGTVLIARDAPMSVAFVTHAQSAILHRYGAEPTILEPKIATIITKNPVFAFFSVAMSFLLPGTIIALAVIAQRMGRFRRN